MLSVEPPKSHIECQLTSFAVPTGTSSSGSIARSATAEAQAACPECGKMAERHHVGGRGPRLQGIRVLPHRLRQERASEEGAERTRRPTARSRGGRRSPKATSRGRESSARSEGASDVERASRSPSDAKPRRVEAGRAAEAEHRRVSAGRELLRAELARARAALGAPDGVEPVLERPRDPAFGDWATNLAMVLAKPLGQKPRDLAQQLDRRDRSRARRASRRPRSPARASSTSALDADACRRRASRALVAAGEQYGRSDARRRTPGRTSSSCARIPPVRCTSVTAARPRSATRSRRCSSGPGGTSRASSTTTTPACRSRTSR